METPATTIPRDSPKKILDAEKIKSCLECGICTASCPMVELVPEHYNPRSIIENLLIKGENILSQKDLWLCAWCYRCFELCPQALNLPETFLALRNKAITKGFEEGFQKALETIIKETPLPLVSFYVCFHPERSELEKKVLEKALKQIYRSLNERTRKPVKKKGKVAVIGSGPAGLTVTHELANKGYDVTIFEALPELGGMLRKCIPEFRLPKQVLNYEIQRLTKLGVAMKTNVKLGEDVVFEDLWTEGFKAIFVGVGAHRSRSLSLEGENLKGIFQAVDFLWRISCGEDVALGERVAVVGGGNVAFDAARTALRKGADSVTVLYRRTRGEMPANPWEVWESEKEGVKIQFLVVPKRFLGENGSLEKIECVKMRLGEVDRTGRRSPLPIENSEFEMNFDTVILAVGESPDTSFLPESIEIKRDNTLWVNPASMETNIRGVFAGGDVVSGPASVISAIVAGRKAAQSIDQYLKKKNGGDHFERNRKRG